MKTVELIFPMQGHLPKKGVKDTGLKGGVDDNWCPGHVYEINEKVFYINPDYFRNIDKKEVEFLTKRLKEAQNGN